MAELMKVYECTSCRHRTIVYSHFCPECRERRLLLPKDIAGYGQVYAFTSVHVYADMLSHEAPYLLIMFEGEGGFRLMGRMYPASAPVEIGTPVELFEVKEGEYLFRLSTSTMDS